MTRLFYRVRNRITNILGFIFCETYFQMGDYFDDPKKINPERSLFYNYDQHLWYRIGSKFYSIGCWFYDLYKEI